MFEFVRQAKAHRIRTEGGDDARILTERLLAAACAPLARTSGIEKTRLHKELPPLLGAVSSGTPAAQLDQEDWHFEADFVRLSREARRLK